eukprot:CAMPEP_0172638280 /NCGR_PEP_ID=MMETSP1068-20121228/213116_1 /TAXON_ID=35684 /ORGANISM="Pseudopedinella elastica, Strain CCMP716" /LENGTH=86 /DNA_ID=CAMNT_0013451149 /DNA_START=122 /DNA_END=378 /DNA_ORIENTATION=+
MTTRLEAKDSLADDYTWFALGSIVLCITARFIVKGNFFLATKGRRSKGLPQSTPRERPPKRCRLRRAGVLRLVGSLAALALGANYA